MNKLPTKLKKEPLVDAIFELRFNATAPFSNIFPGVFFSKLDGNKSIETLPTAELPKLFRDNDPNLQFAPILRIHWKDNFLVLVSDKSVAVTCKLPYPGWDNFKKSILDIIDLIKQIGIVDRVHRYALKYVDIIPTDDTQTQASYINFDVSLGKHKLSNESFHFRIEIPENEIINVVQIFSFGNVILADGTNKEGLVIDIDTIYDTDNQMFNDFLEQVSGQLDCIHEVNKKAFFNCITPATLAILEPQYE
jgi:uncharacterized protein (TIGR04255 family)